MPDSEPDFNGAETIEAQPGPPSRGQTTDETQPSSASDPDPGSGSGSSGLSRTVRSKSKSGMDVSLARKLYDIQNNGFCKTVPCWDRGDSPYYMPGDSLGHVFVYMCHASEGVFVFDVKKDNHDLLEEFITQYGQENTFHQFLRGIEAQTDYRYVYPIHLIREKLVGLFGGTDMSPLINVIDNAWNEATSFYYILPQKLKENISVPNTSPSDIHAQELAKIGDFVSSLALFEYHDNSPLQTENLRYAANETWDRGGNVFDALRLEYSIDWMDKPIHNFGSNYDEVLRSILVNFFSVALDQRRYQYKLAGVDYMYIFYATGIDKKLKITDEKTLQHKMLKTAHETLQKVFDCFEFKDIDYISEVAGKWYIDVSHVLPPIGYENTLKYMSGDSGTDFLVETLQNVFTYDGTAKHFFGIIPGFWNNLHWGKTIYDVWKTKSYWEHVALYNTCKTEFWEYFFVDIVAARGDTTTRSPLMKLDKITADITGIFAEIKYYIQRNDGFFVETLYIDAENLSFLPPLLPPPGSTDNTDLLEYVKKTERVFQKTAGRVRKILLIV